MFSLVKVEFYERGGELITGLFTSAVPRSDETINIKGQQWRVAYVSWAIDTYNGRPQLRANVELEKIPDDEVGPKENYS